MNTHLMNKNTAYRLRIPISFLLAIVVSVFMNKANSINNFFIAHILIPISIFLIVWFAIDISVRSTVSKEKLNILDDRCTKFVEDTKQIEKFNNMPPANNVKIAGVKAPVDKVKAPDDKVHNLRNYISTDASNFKIDVADQKAPSDKGTDTSHEDEDKYAHPNTNNGNAIKRYYSNFPLGNTYPPESKLTSSTASGCLLGKDECSPLCSGLGKNSCDIVSPIPGPTWQVQSSSTVQHRLKNKMYTPSTCSLGPTILRDAEKCTNLTDENRGLCNKADVECKNSRMFN
jgi:hypothetical protein